MEQASRLHSLDQLARCSRDGRSTTRGIADGTAHHETVISSERQRREPTDSLGFPEMVLHVPLRSFLRGIPRLVALPASPSATPGQAGLLARNDRAGTGGGSGFAFRLRPADFARTSRLRRDESRISYLGGRGSLPAPWAGGRIQHRVSSIQYRAGASSLLPTPCSLLPAPQVGGGSGIRNPGSGIGVGGGSRISHLASARVAAEERLRPSTSGERQLIK